MPSLREFIPVRHREIIAEVAQAQTRVRDLSRELDDLRRAAESVGIDLADSGTVENIEASEPERTNTLRDHGDETIKEAAMSVMQEAGRNLTAMDILQEINKRLGTSYPRTSLSPQLSRLKQDGRLDLENNMWSVKRVKEINVSGRQMFEIASTKTEERKPHQWGEVLKYMVDVYPAVLTNDDLVQWGWQNGHTFSRHQLRASLFNWRKREYVEAIADGQHRATRKGAESVGRLIDAEIKEGPTRRLDLL